MPVEGLEPRKGDLLVEKTRMNGLFSNLDNLLRGFGPETIIVSGAWTNMSVEHSTRLGADADYRIVVAGDGTSTIDDKCRYAPLNYAPKNIAAVETCSGIAAAMQAGAGDFWGGVHPLSPRVHDLVNSLERLGTGSGSIEGPLVVDVSRTMNSAMNRTILVPIPETEVAGRSYSGSSPKPGLR